MKNWLLWKFRVLFAPSIAILLVMVPTIALMRYLTTDMRERAMAATPAERVLTVLDGLSSESYLVEERVLKVVAKEIVPQEGGFLCRFVFEDQDKQRATLGLWKETPSYPYGFGVATVGDMVRIRGQHGIDEPLALELIRH